MEKTSIYQKLLEAQKELTPILKEKENPFFKSKYADINAFIETIRPVLHKHNLGVLQPLTNLEGKVALETILFDVDGNEIKSITPIELKDNDPQKVGSAITYYRRYALQSLLLMQAEDNDGKKVTKLEEKKIQKMEKHEEAIANITDVEELKKYYKANEGDGKEFAKLVTARKKELE